MAPGGTRILPFAVISTVVHAAVLMSAPERLEIAVTPGGDSGPVAVRLVPSGPSVPDPAAQSGVAGSIPEPSRRRDRQSEPAAAAVEATGAVASAADESPEPSQQEAPEPEPKPDRAQAESADRTTTDQKERPDESGATPDTPDEPAKTTATAKTATPDPPETPEAAEPSDPPEPARAEDANAADAAARTAEAPDPASQPDHGEAAENEKQTGKRSGAEGADDRAQLASHARQQVRIHFRDRFRYPRIARQRGWEGRVVLTFRLQPDGRITDVEVAESSGRSILDENARQTLIHIRRVPELADRLGSEPLELEVPVTYRLQPA